MSSGVQRTQFGAFTADGNAHTVSTVGFKPRKVVVRNVTGLVVGVWTESMPDAAALLTIDSGAASTDLSYITTDGITPTNTGFTVGANADLNANAEVLHWEAHE